MRKSAEACKKAERKHVTIWKALTAVTLILAVAVSACSVALSLKESAASDGNGPWQVVGKDAKAIYYSQDHSSQKERLQEGKELAYQVAAEGVVLLTNNGALPLADGAKVSAYGEPEGLKAALESAGLTVNPAGDMKTSVADYGDALILTVTRAALEETLAPSYLQLNEAERTMLSDAARLKTEGKVKSVILLLSTAYPMQMDFLKADDTVDACLWIGNVGASGIGAVADILAGLLNPSGRLTDTYCYDISSAPAMKSGSAEGETLVYQEGVYVGYKYYETRYEDYVMVEDNTGEYHYSEEVAFPFGHGLSYTTFEYSDLAAGYNSSTDQYELYFLVTNMGEVAGKETVQVYAQTPYTEYDRKYGVEKPSVALVSFTKTKLLEPGETEELVIYIDRRDLASFDVYGKGTYIVEPGAYYLTLAKDSHDAVSNILARKGYDMLDERMDAPGSVINVYHWKEEKMDAQSYSVSNQDSVIGKWLSDSDPNLNEGTRGNDPKVKTVNWLSRNDWEGTFPTGQTLGLQAAEAQPENSDAQLPAMGADKGIKLQQLRNKGYQDALWNSFLDQLTFEDMIVLLTEGVYRNAPEKTVETTVFPGQTVIAATFNRELCYSAALLMGNDHLAAETFWVDGPSVNIHRTPLVADGCSEDSYLSGEICTALIYGLEEKGINASLENFGINEPGKSVWLSEQAARETYLRSAFLVLDKVTSNNITVSDTRWGGVSAAGNAQLLSGILQGEWVWKGAVIADSADGVVEGLLAGTTVFAATSEELTAALSGYANDPAVVSAMREACHRNLYMVVNSAQMNGFGENTTVQRKGQQVTRKIDPLYILVPALCWMLTAVMLIMWQRGKKRWVNTEEYKNYIALLENKKK